MNGCTDVLHVVEITAVAADAPVLEELISALGVADSAWCDTKPGEVATISIARQTERAAVALESRICEELTTWLPVLSHGMPGVRRRLLPREDWAETWKRHFHTFRIASRLVIKPSWEDYAARPGDVILDLDPGMSFGTGHHGTTRACLELLERLSDQLGSVSFLDVGCGSGILSLAAAKLGFSPVWAFDNDPLAVEVTERNLATGGVRGVSVRCQDLARFAPGQRFRVVAANILATVLIDESARLVGCLDAASGPAYLLLSGILSEQYDDVRSCYRALGLRETETRTIDEWTSGCYLLAGA